MQRAILLLVSLFVVLFSSINALMVGIGRTQAHHAALDGFTDPCANLAQPCWNGIIPGQTTIEEARQIMAYAGSGDTLFNDITQSYILYFIPPQPSALCAIIFQTDETVVARVQIQVCKEANIKIGDLTAALGLPERLILVPPQNIVYKFASISTDVRITAFSPDSPIGFINVLRPTARRRAAYGWHGFVPAWRYCQLEPEYPLCQ